MSRSVYVIVRQGDDVEKLINSAAVAGFLVTQMVPDEERMHLVVTNASAANPESDASWFESKTGVDITP